MLKKALVAAALSFFSASSAFAGSCPVMVKAIDASLSSGTSLSGEEIVEVKALRDKGDAEHAAGKHAEAVATLQKAKDMLGL